MEEPKQGKWGLWYANGAGHATREEALKAIQSRKANDAGASSRRMDSGPGRIVIVLLAAVVVGAPVVSWWLDGREERAERRFAEAMAEAEREDMLEALSSCQRAIGLAAAYGKSNNPGYTQGKRIGNVWQFLWPRGSFHFKNGFGVDVPQSARCEVAVSTGKIVRLIVSGEEIVKR